MKIALSKIKPSPDNAAGRSKMTPEMEELIATIKAVGVCEGISVRPKGKDYEIIGGERRWFAAKKAGIKKVDAIVHDVDKAQARLMRLASLSHEDWEYEEFAKNVWRELEERDITIAELARLTGISSENLHNAQGFQLASMDDCVVVIDGEVQAHSTSVLGKILKNQDLDLRRSVATKASSERIQAKQVQYLCHRIKKALPNIVEFGEPEDKDYEEHNFEIEAILRIQWSEEEYEKKVKSMAQALHDTNWARWQSQRFGKKELKVFTKATNKWKEELRKILKFKKAFTWEQAQFTLNLLNTVDELVSELTEELDGVYKKGK